jgi:hypothetical protein
MRAYRGCLVLYVFTNCYIGVYVGFEGFELFLYMFLQVLIGLQVYFYMILHVLICFFQTNLYMILHVFIGFYLGVYLVNPRGTLRKNPGKPKPKKENRLNNNHFLSCFTLSEYISDHISRGVSSSPRSAAVTHQAAKCFSDLLS